MLALSSSNGCRERETDNQLDIQITDPSGSYETQINSVSSGDYSFDARMDGKYVYCFSNEHWSANSKEVSFNVHGIVYVPESEAPQDPLETEGMGETKLKGRNKLTWNSSVSPCALRPSRPGKG